MATTRTGPDLSFSGGLGDLKDFALDDGRAKLIDVEQVADDKNMPDHTDVRTGQAATASRQPGQAAPSASVLGVGIGTLIVLGLVGVGVVLALRG